MSDEVQKQLKVIKRPVAKPALKPTPRNIAKAKAVIKKSAVKTKIIKKQLK